MSSFSGNLIVKMSSFSDKTPPSFDKRTDDFSKWRKKFWLWSNITEVEKRKLGSLLLLRLDDDTQDRINELISDEDLIKDDAPEVILQHLNTLFGKDESVTTFELYEQFESFKRPVDMTIAEYCDEFDRKLKKLQAKGTQLPEPVLVLKLLKSANLSEFDERLVRATIGEHKYANMAEQLKRVFPIGASVRETVSDRNNLHIKDEPREVNETLYYRGNSRDDNRSFSNKSGSANYSLGTHNTTPNKLRGTNKLDMHGNVTRCLICDSVKHYMKDCTHRFDNKFRINKGKCLESDEVKSSDDGSFTYEIADVEARHTVHPCRLRFEIEHIAGEKATDTEKECNKVKLVTNQPTQMQARYMVEEDVDEFRIRQCNPEQVPHGTSEAQVEIVPESQIHTGTLYAEENIKEQDQVTHDASNDEEVSDEEKSVSEQVETVETRGRQRKYTKSKVIRATKGNNNIYCSKKATSALKSKKLDGPTVVSRRAYKHWKAKHKGAYAGAASGHLHQGTKMKKRKKKRVRYNKVQRREKRRIRYAVFKSKQETKALWKGKGKKPWKKRKKRRVWDGKIHKGSWNLLEKLEGRRSEEKEVEYKERKETEFHLTRQSDRERSVSETTESSYQDRLKKQLTMKRKERE